MSGEGLLEYNNIVECHKRFDLLSLTTNYFSNKKVKSQSNNIYIIEIEQNKSILSSNFIQKKKKSKHTLNPFILFQLVVL